MASTRFKPDRELSTRMLVVMFLLGLLYVGAIAALIAYGFNAVLVLVIAGGALAAAVVLLGQGCAGRYAGPRGQPGGGT